jgi:hypothetical protein
MLYCDPNSPSNLTNSFKESESIESDTHWIKVSILIFKATGLEDITGDASEFHPSFSISDISDPGIW